MAVRVSCRWEPLCWDLSSPAQIILAGIAKVQHQLHQLHQYPTRFAGLTSSCDIFIDDMPHAEVTTNVEEGMLEPIAIVGMGMSPSDHAVLSKTLATLADRIHCSLSPSWWC